MALNGEQSTKVLDWVDGWRADAVELRNPSTASQLTGECMAVFRSILKRLPAKSDPSRASAQSMKQSYSSLALWESGYGIAEGELDESLARSRLLTKSILELLISISETLTNRVLPLLDIDQEALIDTQVLISITAEAQRDVVEDLDEESEDDKGSDSSSVLISDCWSEIAEDLSTDVQCLLDLDPIIDSPPPDRSRTHIDHEKPAFEWQPHLSYGDKIKNRFPNAGANLIDRLARANWERFLRTKASREQCSIDRANAEKEIEIGIALTEPSSKFHDSGLGTTVYSGSAYAETVMSYRAHGRDSIRVPSLPDGAKEGIPFECLACGKRLMIRDNSTWKKHLYQDLCPWICHDVHCKYSNQDFDSRNNWIEHLGLDHAMAPEWKSFKCPLCNEETGNGKSAISRHLSDHLEEISLAALPLSADNEEESISSGSEIDVVAGGTAEDEEPYTIKCICNFCEDDGNTIYCETCDTWQHIHCFYPSDPEKAVREDFDHSCADCQPRPLDRQRAVERGFMLQRSSQALRTQIMTGTAPSSSSKTNARREKELQEKNRRLSEAAMKTVSTAGEGLTFKNPLRRLHLDRQ